MLRVEGLAAGWGEARILHGIDLTVAEGEAVALLGRNGAGKTTLLSALIGIARSFEGRIAFGPTRLDGLPPEKRAALGLGWVPQERNIFRSLTVEENLTAVARPGPWTLARMYQEFPRLQERRGNLGSALSGGEQQMLAMARALMLNPKLLLLDEPLEGLAPVIAQQILAAIRRMTQEEGLAAIIVEQHPHLVLPITHRALVLERGQVVLDAPSAELIANPGLAERHLGLAR